VILKRTFTVVAMVVLAAILIASPVLAAGSSRTMEVAIKKPTRMFMTATIEIDQIHPEDENGQIYVEIYMTNRAFRQYRGEFAWVKIEYGTTLCLDWVNKRKSKPIPMDCGDLTKDDKVNIKAKVVEDAYGQTTILAKRVVRKQRSIRH
jgi:hypothetical protein